MNDHWERARVAAVAKMDVENAARLEDLTFMIDNGESLQGAARRLGIKPKSLERWCELRGLNAEAATLRARDPKPQVDNSAACRAAALARWAS